jgi:HemY protein
LARYYGLVTPKDKDKQLKTAHSWFKQHSEDPMLLLTLGRLYLREDILGQANIYLEKSAAIAPSPEVYLLLGDVAIKMNAQTKGEQYYKQGLHIACQNKGDQYEAYSSDFVRVWGI